MKLAKFKRGERASLSDETGMLAKIGLLTKVVITHQTQVKASFTTLLKTSIIT